MLAKLLSGTGKGAYFVRLYSELFEEKLGIRPFPGTLNLVTESVPILSPLKKISIQKEGYGAVDCYPILFQGYYTYKAFLLRPHKTTHTENILEIISEINLRKHLNVRDGDVIECELA